MTTYGGTTAGNLKDAQGFQVDDFYRVGDDIFINPDTPTRGDQDYRMLRTHGWKDDGGPTTVLRLVVKELENIGAIPVRDSAEEGDLQVD